MVPVKAGGTGTLEQDTGDTGTLEQDTGDASMTHERPKVEEKVTGASELHEEKAEDASVTPPKNEE